MIKVKDGYAKLIGTTYSGSASRVLLSNGGDHVLGNASGNIPLSNGTVNTNLNADLLDGLHASSFLRYYSANTDITNVNVVNTPSFLHTVSTTGNSPTTITKPSGIDNAWGVLHVHVHKGDYAMQLGFGGTTGNLYQRHAYSSSTFGSWKTILDSSNYSGILDSRYYTETEVNNKLAGYLPLAGGTMNNGAIIKFNANGSIIQTTATTSNATTMILWYQGTAKDANYSYAAQIGWHNTGDSYGAIYLIPNPQNSEPWGGGVGLYIGKTLFKWNNNAIIHAGNYTTYTVKKDGTGATGTWGISITGNAASATKITVRLHTGNDIEYPLVWTNYSDANSNLADLLYKSYNNLMYNPKNNRITASIFKGNLQGNATSATTATDWSRSVSWNAITTVNAWSRILKINGYSNILLTVNYSQSSLASLHLYLVSTGYQTGNISLIGYNKYSHNSKVQVRLTRSSDTIFYVEIYNNYGYNSATTVTFGCRATNLSVDSAIEVYKTYTAGGNTVIQTITSSHEIASNFNADMLDGKHLSSVIYAPNSGSALTGTSEESGKSSSVSRTTFWRDNNIGRIGVTVLHSENAGYGWTINAGYSGTRFYTNIKTNGTWNSSEQTIAFLSDIPTVTNYYWANLAVQTTSSNTTVPSFGAIRMNGATSAGTNYITGSAGRIYFGGNFHLDSLGSNATYINHYTANNVYMCTGTSQGKVGIRTASPSYVLHVVGDTYTSGWSRAANGFYVQDTGVHFSNNQNYKNGGEIAITSNNEFNWATGDGTIYFNYRAAGRGTTVNNYVWHGGSSSTYATHTLGNLTTRGTIFLNSGDATLKIYSGRITDAKSDGNICLQTCIDGLDGQTHSYAPDYQARENLVLLPRGGQVYIGTNPDGGNTSYKLYVNGGIFSTGFTKSGSSDSYALLGGGGHKAVGNASGNIPLSNSTKCVNLNADLLDGYHISTAGTTKPWSTIVTIGSDGVSEMGRYIDFHYDNTTGSDYSTRLLCGGNHSNVVTLPSATGTLALTSLIPSSLPANGGSANKLNSANLKSTSGLHYYYAGGITTSTDNTGNYVGPNSNTTYSSVLRLQSHATAGLLYYRDLIFDVNSDYIWSRRVTNSSTPSLVSILHSGNSSVSGGGSSWGSSITVKIADTTATLTIPSNPNTHWTTRIYAGASGTAANAAATNPYLKVTDDNTYRNLVRFVGGGATTVSSDASGNITISSTDNNTTYSAGTGLALSGTKFYTTVPRVTKSCNSLPGKNTWVLEEYTSGSDYNLPSNHYYHIYTAEGPDVNYATLLALGMTTRAVYYRNYSGSSWNAWQSLVNTDTKNTAGSTNSTSKLFLIGATSQADNPQTYSNSNLYATDGFLYAKGIYANVSGSSTAGGISLYGNSDPMTYGIAFRGTGTYGTHGYVTADWATYLTMNDLNGRGWIFRRGSTNVASIDSSGLLYTNGRINGSYYTSRVATGTQPYACTSTTLNTNLNADLLDGVHASGLFTSLANSGNNISVTIGGTNKTLVPAYATNSGSAGKLTTAFSFGGGANSGKYYYVGSITLTNAWSGHHAIWNFTGGERAWSGVLYVGFRLSNTTTAFSGVLVEWLSLTDHTLANSIYLTYEDTSTSRIVRVYILLQSYISTSVSIVASNASLSYSGTVVDSYTGTLHTTSSGPRADTIDGYHISVGSSAGSNASTIYFVI